MGALRGRAWCSCPGLGGAAEIKISAQELAAVNLVREPFQGDWNYTVIPLVDMLRVEAVLAGA